MANIKQLELSYFEELFEMNTGYVLDFTNNKFKNFVLDSAKKDIYEEVYSKYGDSKAKRLKYFIDIENNYIVSRLLSNLLDYWRVCELRKYGNINNKKQILYDECKKVIDRLNEENINIEVLATDEEDFSILFDNIKLNIENGQVNGAIDRLHTYMIKFARMLCNNHQITYMDTEPLHNLFGKYIKYLEISKLIESKMTISILKSNIKILDNFNFVRNNQSLSHDNEVLNYDESIYIFNSIIALKVFIESIESKI